MRKIALLVPVLLAGCIVHERHYEYESMPPRNPVTVDGVVASLRAGVPQPGIRAGVQANGVQRTPTADDIIALKQAGAGDDLIREMVIAPVTTPHPGEVVRVVRYDYDTRAAEGAFLFGVGAALTGWAIHRDHYHGYHRHYHGCGH